MIWTPYGSSSSVNTPIGNVRRVAHPTAEPITLAQARTHLRLTPFGSPSGHPDDDWVENFGIPAARELCEQETGLAFAPATFEFSVGAFPTRYAPTYGSLRYGLPLPMAAPLIEIVSVTHIVQDSVTDGALTGGLIPTSEVVLTIDGTLVRVSSLTLKDSATTPLDLVEDTDYTFDKTTGTVTMLTAPGTQPYLATYTYTATRTLDAFDDYMLDATARPGVLFPATGGTWPTTHTVPNAVTVRYTAGYDLPGASPVVNPLPYTAAAAMRLTLGHLYENREATTDLRMVELPLGVRDLLRPLSILYEFA